MQDNNFWNLVDLPKGFKPVEANGYIKPRKIIKETLSVISKIGD